MKTKYILDIRDPFGSLRLPYLMQCARNTHAPIYQSEENGKTGPFAPVPTRIFNFYIIIPMNKFRTHLIDWTIDSSNTAVMK